jgi:transcriptional regulator with XRE-family HTH domain
MDSSKTDYTIGTNIKRALIRANKKQTELAEFLEVDKSHVSKWVNNSVTPNRDNIKRIADFTDRTVEELLSGIFNDHSKTDQNKISNSFKADEIKSIENLVGYLLMQALRTNSEQKVNEIYERDFKPGINLVSERIANLIKL